jgi:hypothetical protein
MEKPRPPLRRWVAILVLALTGCSGHVAVEDLPDPQAVLTEAGRRLSRSMSERALTAIAARGDRVLAVLNRPERDALGRGSLRFRVDRAAIVDVAAPAGSIPFWVADQHFTATGIRLGARGETPWLVFRKTFPAGRIGLGVNGLDRSPSAHYAVFVRAADGGPPPALTGLDPSRWRTTEARDEVSAAWDAAVPLGPLPGALRGALLLQSSHDQRHATRLASGRVWKTHVVSSRAADQVAIAFGPDPARSLVWTWRTEPGLTRTALRLAPAAPGGQGPSPEAKPRIIAGDSHTIETPSVLNDPTIRRHRALATGLEPDTVYAYALGDGSPGGWSPWRSVRTAPGRSKAVRFLYLGDPQTGLEAWGKLLQHALERNPDAGFLLIAGDLVDRGNERTNWDHFFLRAAGVFDRLPMMPCAGNHDYLDRGPRLYRAFFSLPENGPEGVAPGLVYSFEYADAFIAVLDSTSALYEPATARRQADWLDARLARTRASWKFVMFHHPVYASHPTRESPSLRAAWEPVFDRHHVDLVLQGHDHAYLRSYPMRAGHRVASPAEGTVYVVSVSGDKYYDQNERDYTALGLTQRSTYQTIDIEPDERRLVYRVWDTNGREFDRLVIEKRQSEPIAD